MVGTGTLLGNHAGRTGLELAVLDNGKANTPPVQVGVISSDTSFDGGRVVWIRQMTGLSPLHLLDIFDGHGIPTVRRTGKSRFLAVVTPDIGLSDIMVIGNAHGREIPDHLSEITTKPQPGGVVAAMVVNLVTGKEKKVRLKPLDILHQILLRYVASMTGVD